MDTSLIVEHEVKDKRKAQNAAFIFAILLIFLILYPFWSYPFPPPGQEGVLISFGELDAGGNSDNEDSQKEEVAEPNNRNNDIQQSEKLEKNDQESKAPDKTVSKITSKSVTTEKSDVVVNVKEKKKEVSEKPNIPNKESTSQQKESDDANKRAEFEQAKKQFGELIGKGAAANNNSGNAGDPAGDPNADNLSGISKGKGNIGGGLAERGVIFEPEIEENSQKSGKVVVRVCVDKNGSVVEAKYTQKGSTTTDTDLVNVAVEGSKRYKFSKTPIEKQCGTITIEFKLK